MKAVLMRVLLFQSLEKEIWNKWPRSTSLFECVLFLGQLRKVRALLARPLSASRA